MLGYYVHNFNYDHSRFHRLHIIILFCRISTSTLFQYVELVSLKSFFNYLPITNRFEHMSHVFYINYSGH